MKESVTKFDIEAAFKALDEINVPVADVGIKANKPALTEIFSNKSKFESLFEEYYDISSGSAGLNDAKDAREAEIAKAKLARIEKIVDLDAETPEDLLTSYVGKLIIQCPQCMTLFYKNPEDVEESEDDAETVNVNEVCQHCGNESGYTLIGKVGEASQDELDNFDVEELDQSEEADASDEDSLDDDTKTVDVDSTEEPEDEDFDLDSELEAFELENEENEESEEDSNKKEESHFVSHEGNTLVEELHEEVDTEVSAEDFEKLINSPEFKKPISDSAVRSMLNAESEENETSKKESLEEGIIDKIKNKFTAMLDKTTDQIDSREAKANWVLKNALKEYNDVKVDAEGRILPDDSNKRFKTFVVVGYTNKFSNDKEIKLPPSYNNEDLVVGNGQPVVKANYSEADKYAKGWSMRQGNGPAFIYMAKDANDDKAVFLCQYFKGNLENDQLDYYFEVVKKDLEGADLIADSNVNSEANYKETKVSEVKKGMKVQFDDETAEITNIKQSRIGKDTLAVEVKFTDGSSEVININANAHLNILNDTVKMESLDNFMMNLEELHESSLENYIANSLIESYKNVAGFRLKECSYLNEQFVVNGTIHFTSGKTRQTSYIFTEAFSNENGLTELLGTNEKLGSAKKFIIAGRANKKTFITESFKTLV